MSKSAHWLALSVFVLGIVAAGLSSTFPNYLLRPWTVFDVAKKSRRMDHPRVRIAGALVAMLGFFVPSFLRTACPAHDRVASCKPGGDAPGHIAGDPVADRQTPRRPIRNPIWLTVALWLTLAFSPFRFLRGNHRPCRIHSVNLCLRPGWLSPAPHAQSLGFSSRHQT